MDCPLIQRFGRWRIDLTRRTPSVAAMFGTLRKWRRRRLGRLPFPAAWLGILRERVPYYRLLSPDEQAELRKLIRVFLAEKKFEGCGGLEITDEIRVTIAAQACILLLNREHDYYAGLHSVLVYPSSYLAPSQFVDAAGVWHEEHQTRLGDARSDRPFLGRCAPGLRRFPGWAQRDSP